MSFAGYLVLALLLLTLGGFMLFAGYRELDRRACALEEGLSRQGRAVEDAVSLVDAASDESRRAHLRLDRQEKIVRQLGSELGWVDDRAHTQVLTAPIPAMALPSRRPGPPTLPTLPKAPAETEEPADPFADTFDESHDIRHSR